MKTIPKPKLTPSRSVMTNGEKRAVVVEITSKNKDAVVELKPLRIKVIKLHIVGDSPLIVHAWSYKAQMMMLDKQMKKAAETDTKAAKDPVQCFKDTLSVMPGNTGFGFPAIAIKQALVAVANHMDLKKVDCRYAFHVVGDLVPITAPPLVEPFSEWDHKYWKEIEFEAKHGASMRMDMVRIGMGIADIRFRAQFLEWEINNIPIRYNASIISPEQITNLAELAGFSNGLGEWRPQKDGGFGMFHVKRQ